MLCLGEQNAFIDIVWYLEKYLIAQYQTSWILQWFDCTNLALKLWLGLVSTLIFAASSLEEI